MRLWSLDVPCGCDARKEIMFTHGDLGVPEAAVLIAAVLAMVVGYKVGKR